MRAKTLARKTRILKRISRKQEVRNDQVLAVELSRQAMSLRTTAARLSVLRGKFEKLGYSDELYPFAQALGALRRVDDVLLKFQRGSKAVVPDALLSEFNVQQATIREAWQQLEKLRPKFGALGYDTADLREAIDLLKSVGTILYNFLHHEIWPLNAHR